MSEPINIFKNPNNPNDNNVEYIYQLYITFRDGYVKNIMKVSNNNYITLLDYTDFIEYKNIDSFSLTITKVDLQSYNYMLEGIVNEQKKIFKNNDIYLEFTKNETLYTKCNCTINTINKNRLFFTPPNY